MFAKIATRGAAATATFAGIALVSANLHSSACAPAHAAVAILGPQPFGTDTGVRGQVYFKQRKDENVVRIKIHVTNLSPGKHGFHIHSLGNLTQGCVTAGGHFNPAGVNHGGPADDAKHRHVGDLGNIVAGEDGTVWIDVTDDMISLKTGSPNSIIGRSVVIHADEDDLGKGTFPDSKTTGHAGARVACGVIGLDEDADI